MTDFGADDAFRPGTAKLKEHYGIEMPVSTVQRMTEYHAEGIYAQERARVIEPGTAAGFLIGEMDGSMVPVVEPAPDVQDPRKGKRLSWKQVHLNLVHPKGSVTPYSGEILPAELRKVGGSGNAVRRKRGLAPRVSCMRSAMAHRGLLTNWICTSGPRGTIWSISSISASINSSDSFWGARSGG